MRAEKALVDVTRRFASGPGKSSTGHMHPHLQLPPASRAPGSRPVFVPIALAGAPRARRVLALAMLGGSVLAASSCRDGSAAVASTGKIAIGVGAIPGSPGFEGVVRGISMAVERLNEQGGTTFELRLPSIGATSAVQVAQQLRDDPSVMGVVGHPESGKTLEAIPVYEDAEHAGRNAVVAVSPTASSPQLSGISKWFFRVAPSDSEAARFVAQFVRDSLQLRRAAVIFRNDSYGRDWSATFSAEYQQHGATIVSRNPYLTSITEWDAYAQLLARQRPDVLLFPGDATDAVEMLEALKSAGVTLTFIGGDGTEGMQDNPIAEGARFVAFFRPERVTTEEGKTFVRRFKTKFGVEPDMFAAMSYDAALVIGQSIRGGANTRVAVRDALEKMGTGKFPGVEGAGGLIVFEPDHDIKGRSVVVTQIGSNRRNP